MNDDFTNDSMLELYLFESTTLLDSLDEILLRAESERELTPENINEIFRIMHTIKGSSAMMSFSAISDIAHQTEDLFSIIRESGINDAWFDGLFDQVLRVSDFLKEEVRKIQEGEALTDEYPGLTSELDALIERFRADAPEKPKPDLGRMLGGMPRMDSPKPKQPEPVAVKQPEPVPEPPSAALIPAEPAPEPPSAAPVPAEPAPKPPFSVPVSAEPSPAHRQTPPAFAPAEPTATMPDPSDMPVAPEGGRILGIEPIPQIHRRSTPLPAEQETGWADLRPQPMTADGPVAGGELNTFNLHVHFNDGARMENIRAFMLVNKLSEAGTVNRTKPEDLENNPKAADEIVEEGLYINFTTGMFREQVETMAKGTLSVESVTFVRRMPGETNVPPPARTVGTPTSIPTEPLPIAREPAPAIRLTPSSSALQKDDSAPTLSKVFSITAGNEDFSVSPRDEHAFAPELQPEATAFRWIPTEAPEQRQTAERPTWPTGAVSSKTRRTSEEPLATNPSPLSSAPSYPEEPTPSGRLTLLGEPVVLSEEAILAGEATLPDEAVLLEQPALLDESRPLEQQAAPEGTGTVAGKHKANIIGVDLTKLDSLLDLVGEIVINESMVRENPDLAGLELENFGKAARQLNKLTDELQDSVMSVRMVPVAGVFQRMRRIVRDMSKQLDKDVELVLLGENAEVDKTILDALGDPIMHLVRNAMDHAIEGREERVTAGKGQTGHIVLSAQNIGSDIIISVSDDGRGLDKARILEKASQRRLLKKAESEYAEKEIFNLLMMPGFSTRDEVTEFSGRGVGMDVVKANIERIGGAVTIESVKGLGTNVFMKIPLTLAIIDCMEVRLGDDIFSIPISNIRESFKASAGQLISDPFGNEMMMLRGAAYPIIRLHEAFHIQNAVRDLDEGILVLTDAADRKGCLLVDELIGKFQVVVKPLPRYLNGFRVKKAGVSGCTIMGNGNISLIVDVQELLA